MNRNDIIDRLRSAMKRSTQRIVNWDTLTLQTEIAALGFDSLSILDLVYDIQQEFGTEFGAEELIGVKTVGDLVNFLEKRVAP